MLTQAEGQDSAATTQIGHLQTAKDICNLDQDWNLLKLAVNVPQCNEEAIAKLGADWQTTKGTGTPRTRLMLTTKTFCFNQIDTKVKEGLAAGSVDYGSGAVTAATKCAKADNNAVTAETTAAKAEVATTTATVCVIHIIIILMENVNLCKLVQQTRFFMRKTAYYQTS